MGNNKTPVEWLFEKLWDEPKDKFTWYALRKKALEMEKEQIMAKRIDKMNEEHPDYKGDDFLN